MTKNLILAEFNKREEVINTFDKNYLLEAGAGAGKTTLIVERIINQILNTDIDPANIVAITFTKAASTELAERIQAKALDYLKEASNKKVDKLKNVDKIFTGTIHSFCDVILREMPFDANLTPGYEIIEDDQEFYTNIWYNFLRDEQKDYKEIANTLAKFNIDYLRLRTKAIIALANPDIKFCGYDNCHYDFTEIENEFQEIKNKYGHLSSEFFKKQSNLQKIFKSILDDKESLEYYLKAGLLKEFTKKELDAEFLYSDSLLKKHLDNEYQDDYVAFIDSLIEIYRKSNNLAYNKANEIINMVVEYKKDKFKGKLTFNDLLYKASKLIKESDLARDHFKNKYKVFYIDEFQDTDPMQAELIMHLTHKGLDNNDKYWNELEPTPGSLFVVGDPKQSIYRFRRADISTYNQVKDIISKNGEVVELDINFRSSDDICDFVQNTFKKSAGGSFGFEENSSEEQAGFKRILSLWDDMDEETGDKQLRGVYKYTFPEKEDQHYVANIVKDILDNYYIAEKVGRDDYHNNIRKVEYSDILILTKANMETGLYLKAFKEMGIPALLSGEKVLGNTREVMNLFILIDAIIDYRDNIKVVSALRNSFYIDFDSIDLLMEESKYLSSYFFNLEKIKQIKHPSIRNAFLYINNIIKLSRELSPIAFIERIIEKKTGVYELGKDYNSIELRDANSALRQTVEILKAEKCSSIFEIREELKKLIETQVRYELPITEDESKRAIRIMNIHKAKGLEANIVFLVGADKNRNKGSLSHYVEKNDSNENLGFMVHNSEFGIFGPNEPERKTREERFLDAEIDRLLYVAATRAKTCLIVANCENGKGFLYPISANIHREISTDEDIVAPLKDMKLSREKEKELKFNFETRLRREIFLPSYIKATPSQFHQLKGVLEVKKGSNFKEFEYTTKKINEENNLSPRGNIFGTIIHRAFELLITKSDRLKNCDDNIIDYSSKLSIKEEVDKLDINRTNLSLFYPYRSSIVEELMTLKEDKGCNQVKERIKIDLSKYVKDVLINFINNPDIKSIFDNAVEVFTELPFTISVDRQNPIYEKIEKLIDLEDNSKAPILINGTIDLVIKDKSGSFTIIDYKTDVMLDVNSYSSQLMGYKILFEEILKDQQAKVEHLLLYSTFKDKLIRLNNNGYLS